MEEERRCLEQGSGCEVSMAFSNLPESKFEETEGDVKMLDRNDAARKMFS